MGGLVIVDGLLAERVSLRLMHHISRLTRRRRQAVAETRRNARRHIPLMLHLPLRDKIVVVDIIWAAKNERVCPVITSHADMPPMFSLN